GDLFYVDMNDGQIRRIQANQPDAVISADPDHGDPGVTIQFDGSQSTDPNPSATLTYAWDFGDGNFGADSSDPTASHEFDAEGQYSVRLRIIDSLGLSDISSPYIIKIGPPPVPTIISPANESLAWKVGDTISFSGSALDGHNNPLPPSALSWTIL